MFELVAGRTMLKGVRTVARRWAPGLSLDRLEPFVPLTLGVHGLATNLLDGTDSPAATVAFGSVVALAVAGISGWRTPGAVVVRAVTLLTVALSLQIYEPSLIGAMLQWYYGVVAVYPLLLINWTALALGPVVGACYFAEVLAGAHKVPLSVAGLRSAVLTILGLIVYAAGRAYRVVHTESECRRRAAEDAARQQAYAANHDALTNLANRAHFHASLDAALSSAPSGEPLAVLFIDIDRFKTVNDWLGHDIGDKMLIDVANRLARTFRQGDVTARLGGDEFGILCVGMTSAAARAAASAIVESFESPVRVQGSDHVVAVSVGIAVSDDTLCDPVSLLRAADVAMYAAKKQGGNQAVLYDAAMADRTENLVTMEQSLRQALQGEALAVAYQPIVTLADGITRGVEALARWTHEGTPVPPDTFIALAEETGLIGAIGRWVLGTALRDLATWQARGLAVDYVAVNVSPMQLCDPDFPRYVCESLASHQLPAASLMLEVTEGAVMDRSTRVSTVLGDLWERGIKMSVDDFGTGHSSLARLRTLPVSELKIDRSFIDDVPADATLTDSVLSLARSLGLHTVGEGVETPEQCAYLRAAGCDAAQGYFLARPMPADQLAEHMRTPVCDLPIHAITSS